MPKITNTTQGRITAETRHVFEAGQERVVSDEVLHALRRQPYIAGQILRGNLVIERSEPPKPITRAEVAKMRRAELVELLEAIGFTAADLKDRNVEDATDADGLRTMAARSLFVEA